MKSLYRIQVQVMALAFGCSLSGCGPVLILPCSVSACNPVEAPADEPKFYTLGALQKITTTSPILRTGSSVGTDINLWLIMIGDTWAPSTWVMDNRVYLSVPAKINDSFGGGWHRTFASWAPGETAATWNKSGSTVSSGPTPDWGRFDTTADGFNTNNDNKTMNFVVGAGGLIYGIGLLRSNQVGFLTTQFPVVGVTWPAFQSITAVDTSHPNVLTTQTPTHGLFYENGIIYDFWSDSATHTTLTLTQTTDMLTSSAADIVLSTNLSRASVFKYGATYFMVAYNPTSQHWELFSSTSLTSWDFSAPIDLQIRNFVGTASAWDASTFAYVGAEGEPVLTGVRVLGDRAYFFYMAGDFDHPGAAPYGSPRGIGVLSAPLVEK